MREHSAPTAWKPRAWEGRDLVDDAEFFAVEFVTVHAGDGDDVVEDGDVEGGCGAGGGVDFGVDFDVAGGLSLIKRDGEERELCDGGETGGCGAGDDDAVEVGLDAFKDEDELAVGDGADDVAFRHVKLGYLVGFGVNVREGVAGIGLIEGRGGE